MANCLKSVSWGCEARDQGGSSSTILSAPRITFLFTMLEKFLFESRLEIWPDRGRVKVNYNIISTPVINIMSDDAVMDWV